MDLFRGPERRLRRGDSARLPLHIAPRGNGMGRFGGTMTGTTEAFARVKIDALLADAGWVTAAISSFICRENAACMATPRNGWAIPGRAAAAEKVTEGDGMPIPL